MGIFNSKTQHQEITISNNDPNVLGAYNSTAYLFDKSGGYLGTDYNKSNMMIDLADFRQWQGTNKSIAGTVDPRAFSFGFAFLHENYHNRGIGMFGVTSPTLSKWDAETPVINSINAMQNQMGLPSRMGHSRMFDAIGGYIPFSDGSKYYIK